MRRSEICRLIRPGVVRVRYEVFLENMRLMFADLGFTWMDERMNKWITECLNVATNLSARI